MKKLFVVLTAMAFVMAMSLPALAEDTIPPAEPTGHMISSVNIHGDVDKDKDKKVIENVNIDKQIHVIAVQNVKPTNSAQAEVMKEEENAHNEVTVGKVVINTAKVDGLTSTGIVSVNQSPGDMNNQGNAVAIGFTAVGNAILHSESSVEAVNGSNDLKIKDDKAAATELTDTITTTTTGGIAGINQSAGYMNNQDNAVSMSIGLNSVAALAEADLGLLNVGNTSQQQMLAKTDTLGTDVTTVGIAGINQSSGSMNNQVNSVAVTVSMASVSTL